MTVSGEKTKECLSGDDQEPTTENQTEDSSDAESRMRLRSIDVQLLRILEEMSAGRQDTVNELRADLAIITSELRKKNQLDVLRTTGLVFVAIVLGYFFGVN